MRFARRLETASGVLWRGLALAWLALLVAACAVGTREEIVLYTSQDRVYAEPLLDAFRKETGIRVLVVFDSEAVKTVGLVNRLLAEKDHPRCDVFWSNESLRTHELAERGLLSPFQGAASAFRHRMLVVNTNLVRLESAPRRLAALTNAAWRGRVALAYPLFGTTGAHFLMARVRMGDSAWESWAHALASHSPMVLDGNSMVVQTVGRGTAWVGLTDSDDIRAGRREGYPIAAVPIDDVPMEIFSSVGLIRGRPDTGSARKLAEYLSSEAVALALVASGGFDEVALTSGGRAHKAMEQFGSGLLSKSAASTETLRRIFSR